MGIVKRQGAQNMVYTYFGVLLGAFNNIILFQEFLSRGQYGLVTLLLTYMVIGTEVSQLGASRIIIRFFPYFKDDPKRHSRFMTLVSVYVGVGFLAFSLLLWLFSPLVVGMYEENAPLFAQYFLLVIPMVVAYSLQKVLMTLSQSLLKSVLPNFTQQVVQRGLQTIAVLGFFLNWWNFEGFVNFFVWSYFIPCLILMVYLIRLKGLNFTFQPEVFRSRLFRIILNYGLFTTLTETTIILVNRVDMAMLGKMLGEIEAGTYGLAFFIATLVYVPARSLNAIVVPLLAQKIRERNLPAVQELYQKTALNNLLIGGWVAIGIIVNLDAFFELFPKHEAGKWAVIWIAIGTLVNISTGTSRAILINSRFFRFDLIANLALLVLVILTNLWLIPMLGLVGAALATAGSLVVYNSATVLFLWIKLRIQPWTWHNLVGLVLLGIVLGLGLNIPAWTSPIIRIGINSIAVTAVFIPLVLLLRLSPDLNSLAQVIYLRVKSLFGRKSSR